jgi:hypothetical protein
MRSNERDGVLFVVKVFILAPKYECIVILVDFISQ